VSWPVSRNYPSIEPRPKKFVDAELTVDCLVDEKYKPEIYDWSDEFNKE
jgi:hypothetical protein